MWYETKAGKIQYKYYCCDTWCSTISLIKVDNFVLFQTSE